MPVTNQELVNEILRPIEKSFQDHNLTPDRIAQKLDGDLDYKETIYLGKRGRPRKFESPAAKKIQQTAVKMVVDISGWKAADKHVFPGKDGLPQDISGSSRLELATKLLHLAMERKKEADNEKE